MPPGVDDGIEETVHEAQDGQRSGNCNSYAAAVVGVGVTAVEAADVHDGGDEVGHPGYEETAGGEEHHLDGLPFAQLLCLILA